MIGQLPPFPTLTPAPGTPAGTGDPAQADFGRWLAPGALPGAPGPGRPVPLAQDLPGALDGLLAPADLAGRAPPGPLTPPMPPMPPMPLTPPMPATVVPAPASLPAPVELRLVLPEVVLPPAPLPGGDAIRLDWTLSAPEAGGVIQLVATLWQLTAGDRLSQQLQLAGNAPAEPMAPGSRGPAIAPGAAPPPPAAAAGQARAAGSPAPNDAAAGLAFVSAAQRIAAAGAAGSDPAGAGTALLGASFEWPLRLLRWLNEGPQGATAWLRDFTLAPEAMPALVDDLRRFAAAENLPLDRIVLNGRTLWSATSLPPSTP